MPALRMPSSRMPASRRRAPVEVPVDDLWQGPEPNPQENARFETALRRHKDMHTLEDAARSVQEMHKFLQEFDEQGVIPNKNAMQICIQHCFLKSASFCAESICIDAAMFALRMMRRHRCRFDFSTVVQILLAISLRANIDNIAGFVRRLVKTSLTDLDCNQQAFITRHMMFALAERTAAVEASLDRSETFAEKGLRMDWERSSAQEFYLYNSSDDGKKFYTPVEGYGFAKKGLVAILSMEPDSFTQQHYEYKLKRDGAIADVVQANEGEPLMVRLRTQVTIPFREEATYRLDNMDIDELQAKRVMESLRVLGRDPHPQCARQLPHPSLCQMLDLPTEEPFVVQFTLRPKVAPLADELDLDEESKEPVRVRSIGTGYFLNWNHANPSNSIQVGDRIRKVNDATDKDSILEELRHAHQWSKYELKITLMRQVEARKRGITITDDLLPNAEEAFDILEAEKEALSERLNLSQLEAVKAASMQRLSLIQGPPGTGKTTTAVELLVFLLDHKLVPTPILVSGHTNAAVDNLLVGLVERGKRVVRIGEESKVRLECQPYLLGEKCAAEPWNAEVICATCFGSGSGLFQKEGIRCHTVLIDEASQATESACLIPLCHAAQHLILVGDQCQLEPFVKSEFTKSERLGSSLFNRFCRQGVAPTMLNTQYRMNPSICEFPSEAFYNGQLLSGVRHTDRMPTTYWQWPSRFNPVCFIDAKEGVETSSEGRMEKKNELEVEMVLSVLKELMCDPKLRRVCADGTYPVGIVTPYAAQKERILAELVREGFVNESGKHLIEANSVDGFQGREKEIIIFSAVRANNEASVGFLSDWRRINVMLTRAKRGLIVIGHRNTLETDYYWSNWLSWVAMRGCVMGERASGNWRPKCLVEDEWVMKPKSSQICSNAQDHVSDAQQLPCKRETDLSAHSKLLANDSIDSWEDLEPESSDFSTNDVQHGTSRLLEPHTGFCKHEADLLLAKKYLGNDCIASWEDLDRLTTGPEGDCIASWEDLDTSTTGPEADLEASESSFCTDSELSCELLESWEDPETTSFCGPLDTIIRQTQDAVASGSLGGSTGTLLPEGEKDVCNRMPNAAPDLEGELDLPAQTQIGQTLNVLDVNKPEGMENENLGPGCAGNQTRYDSKTSRSANQELSDPSVAERMLESLDLHRLRTPDQFDYPEYHTSLCSDKFASNMQMRQDHASEMGVVWMPMAFPVPHSEVSSYAVPTFLSEAPLHTHQTAPSFYLVDGQSLRCSGVPAPHVGHHVPQLQAYDTHDNHECCALSCAQPQSIKSDFDETSGTHHVVWHADGKKLYRCDHSLISPEIALPVEHGRVVVFKMMILASNGFKKSKGRGMLKLKCESDLGGVETIFTVSFSIGTYSSSPVSHDFSSHPIANLHTQEFDLRSEQDLLSKTVQICLEVRRASEPAVASAQTQSMNIEYANASSITSRACMEGMDHSAQHQNSSTTHGRLRSEAGRQRQRERWLSRLRERANRQ